jgi:nucleoside-diphosphate-sugar epimerase
MDFLTNKFLVDRNDFSGPVLVTGAGGCIGAWVVTILARSGVNVIASDLSANRSRAGLILGDAVNELVWEQCDVTDFSALKALSKKYDISAIIHLAGLQVPFCAANPALGARVNVEGTINILQSARDLNICRTVYASSIAVHGMPPGGEYKATLYGAYKLANEQTAGVYWQDWGVPSIGIRPNVVYGLARDQGMSSLNTIAIQAAVADQAFEMPFSGKYNWLYAGEAAAAFIAGISRDGDSAPVFDLNGASETIERAFEILKTMAPQVQISCSGPQFPFPADFDDGPLREYLPHYPSVTVAEGLRMTFDGFSTLKAQGRLPAIP